MYCLLTHSRFYSLLVYKLFLVFPKLRCISITKDIISEQQCLGIKMIINRTNGIPFLKVRQKENLFLHDLVNGVMKFLAYK